MLLPAAFTARAGGPEILSVAELQAVLGAGVHTAAAFRISGTVVTADRSSAILQDGTGRFSFTIGGNLAPNAGDVGIFSGTGYVGMDREVWTLVDSFDRTGRTDPPAPLDLRLADIDPRGHDLHVVRTEGTVIDAFTDEIDPNYKFMLLKDAEVILPVAIPANATHGVSSLIDARVRITGIFNRTIYGGRKFSGSFISCRGQSSLHILVRPKADSFDYPALQNDKYLSPREVMDLGKRSVVGVVLAVWGEREMMVRAGDGRIVDIELMQDAARPGVGETIKAVGYPRTDLFRVNLFHANVRQEPAAATTGDDPPPARIDIKDIFTDAKGRDNIQYALHGRLLRIQGVVQSLHSSNSGNEGIILIDSGRFHMIVDASSCPEAAADLQRGCRIEATGRCLVKADNWQPDNVFPKLKSVSIIVQKPEDVKVLQRPPWWTPTLLFMVIGALLLAIAAILVWNAMLRRIASRKAHQLFKAQLARTRSDFRLGERTRLAVELHDSLSQALTGIAFELRAANRLAEANSPRMHRHLDMAAKILHSCQEELRDVLWDLRSNTLGITDIGTAINQTLAPHMGKKTKFTVQFAANRRRLSDETTHTILRIIRELAHNAVRHGHATSVKITGAVDENTLHFSVADDGRGFDVDRRRGISEGHFGLQGIHERVTRLGGDVSIKSSPGCGTEVTVRVPIPKIRTEEYST